MSRPVPVPRNNSKPVRRIDLNNQHSVPSVSVSHESDSDTSPLNNFVEDDLVIHGIVNGIHTSVIIDSGAKISLISDDFIDDTFTPVKFSNIFGISQVPKSVPVYELPVVLPTLDGVCQLAVDSRLPPQDSFYWH